MPHQVERREERAVASRRARHLMDPSAPRPARTAASDRALTSVQRWVMSVLAVTTILHLSVGFVIGAWFLSDTQRQSQVGLTVIGAAFGVIAVAAGRAIHVKALLSPWLLLGLVPGLVGLAVVLR